MAQQAQSASSGIRMSYEEFLSEYEGEHAEWVDGEVQLMSPVTDEHQQTVLFLVRLMSEYLDERPLGRVFFEPFQMRVPPKLRGREPDVFFVLNDRLGQLQRAHFDGPADIAVEVVSNESRSRDRGEKFYEYEEGGVREYWLIDPEREMAEFYVRNENGIFETATLDGGVFRSRVLEGFWVRVTWLWERPPLKVALAELGLR